ncbi:MAG: hypothetical protein ACJAVI_002886 [Candidatus Azotimanducaceae bacterium]|jgi:hypothetical protein
MPTIGEDRRQYFRIEDTVGVHYEILTEREAEIRLASFAQEKFDSPGRLQNAERQLQLLIDKLRIQNPEFAEAIELLNIKFNLLKESQIETALEYGTQSFIRKVNISASGISFDDESKIEIGRRMYMNITLLPTDLHVQTMGLVVDCLPSEVNEDEWSIRVEFYGMKASEEELMVQHVVKRQGRLLAERRNNPN